MITRCHTPLVLVWILILVAIVTLPACSHKLTPIALDAAEVPQAVRDLVYRNHSDENVTRTNTDVKWHVSQHLSDDRLLFAATATTSVRYATGQSYSGKYWTVGICRLGESPEITVILNDACDGEFQVDTTSTADYKTLYAGGTGLDSRVHKVVGVIAGDEVTTLTVNGFWLIMSERGTGWSEFRAVDTQGRVLYTLEP